MQGRRVSYARGGCRKAGRQTAKIPKCLNEKQRHTHSHTHLAVGVARSALCVVGANPHLILKFEGVEDNFCTTCHSQRATAAAKGGGRSSSRGGEVQGSCYRRATPAAAAAPFIECSHIKIFYGKARERIADKEYIQGQGKGGAAAAAVAKWRYRYRTSPER